MQTQTLCTSPRELKDTNPKSTGLDIREVGKFIVWREKIKEILRKKTIKEVVIFLIKEIAENHSIKIEELNERSELMEILPPCSYGELATTDLLSELEIHYGIDIPDKDIKKIQTFCDLLNYLKKKTKS